MKIYPAIDIMDGKVVRLLKGDFDESKVYSQNPVAVASEFKAQGAELIHIVDLSGAKKEAVVLDDILPKLVAIGCDIEFGGGIRSIDKIKKLLEIGVKRVIISTRAVSDPEFVAEAVRLFGAECVVVALDVDGGYVRTKGWQENTGLRLEDLLSTFSPLNVPILVTDISKDGTLNGVDPLFYGAIAGKYNGNVIASGGVGSLSDIAGLAGLAKEYPNIEGIVVGKALYEGCFDLKEAIELCSQKG